MGGLTKLKFVLLIISLLVVLKFASADNTIFGMNEDFENNRCDSINLLLESCTNSNDGFKAVFNLENVPVDELLFNFRHGDDYFYYQKSDYSLELQGISITEKVGEGYILEIHNSPEFDEVEISHPDCMTNYVYNKVSCSDSAEVKVGKQLKCSGYLQFNDRFLCRMSITDSEKDEFENKYPEECTNSNNPDHCWKTYQVVEDCWDFKDRDERIGCVKQQLEITDIAGRISACESDDCFNEVKTKVIDLVKFRMHNLQIESEEMWREGSLSWMSFIDFLSKVEDAKQQFNQADDNSERKKIIMDVREYWLDLMRTRLP
jgi:hypothetical protein